MPKLKDFLIGLWQAQRAAALEIALPIAAGAAYVVTRARPLKLQGLASGGEVVIATVLLVAALIGLLILLLLLHGRLPARLRTPMVTGLLAGAAPVLLAALVVTPGEATLRDPVLWCIAIPFAMWCAAARMLETPGLQTRSLFLLANTAAVAALLVPVIGGRIHWGIVILPFAVFRIAAGAGEKIRRGADDAAGLEEARAIAVRARWIGGAWIAGWAGVLP